jgi:hypothetical protein
MIVRSSRLVATTAHLLLALAMAASCRAQNLCESAACLPNAAAVGGVAGATSDRGMPPSAAGVSGALAGASGDGGTPSLAPVATGGGEAGEPATVACEAGFDDCDESRLTLCETDLTWSVRHCGTCDSPCDGACVGGRCEPSTLVADRLFANGMVASATTGFARASDAQGNNSIVRIDLQSGEGQAIQSGVGDDVVLALGADRVYVFDRDTGELLSTELDGSQLTLEPELVGAIDFGASSHGAYYLGSESDPDTFDELQTLWFRATGAATWKKLRGPEPLELRRSSAFGAVATAFDEEYVGHLLLLQGDQLTELGAEPAGLVEAVPTRSAVALISMDYELGESRLHFITPESTQDYVVEAPTTVYDKLIVLGDEVAILSESDGRALVRFYGEEGPTGAKIGIAPSSNLVFADSMFLWYGVNDNWLERRFLRSQWLDFRP